MNSIPRRTGDGKLRYAGLEDWIRKGDASAYIECFHVQPGDRFIVLARVSTHEQGRNDNLQGQTFNLPREVEALGGVVIAVEEHGWSGKVGQWLRKLTAIAKLAQQRDAIILAATTDRLIRSFWFRSNHMVLSQAQAQRQDLIELHEAADGVRLMTFLDPDASPAECKSLLTKWGQEAKGKRGGRPVKAEPKSAGSVKQRRLALLPRVLQLHAERLGYGAIAARLGLPKTTVQRWVKGHA
jgi:hypothetical protein